MPDPDASSSYYDLAADIIRLARRVESHAERIKDAEFAAARLRPTDDPRAPDTPSTPNPPWRRIQQEIRSRALAPKQATALGAYLYALAVDPEAIHDCQFGTQEIKSVLRDAFDRKTPLNTHDLDDTLVRRTAPGSKEFTLTPSGAEMARSLLADWFGNRH